MRCPFPVDSMVLRVLRVFGVVLVSAGCGPKAKELPPDDAAERYAEAVCAAYERCECAGQGFPTVGECKDAIVSIFDRVSSVSGLEFHSDCYDSVLDHFRAATCGGMSEEFGVACLVFTGTIERGENCAPDWTIGFPAGLTEGPCRGDNVCVAGTCIQPPVPLAEEGGQCHLELGVGCGSGLHCSTDGICVRNTPQGQECNSPVACEASGRHYCAGLREGDDHPGVCSEKLASGDACDVSEFVPCGPGLTSYCSAEGICVDEWPAVCSVAHPPPGSYQASEWIPLSR